MDKFDAAETKVFGISTDGLWALKAFGDTNKLAYPLLSDFSTRQVAKDYGVLIEGRGFANRATFVINKEGKIAFIQEGNSAIDPTGAQTACSRLAHKQ